MSVARRSAKTFLAPTGLGLAAFLGLGGCSDEYLARRDTLTLGSGEAMQANAAVHVIDPSPPGSANFARDTNGERLQHGIERYRNPQAGIGLGGGGGYAPVIGGAAPPPAGAPLSR